MEQNPPEQNPNSPDAAKTETNRPRIEAAVQPPVTGDNELGGRESRVMPPQE